MKSRRSSSIFRAAPELRLPDVWDGGVRPAARCPASVRSRSPSRDLACASASCAGFPRLPVAVRGERAFATAGVDACTAAFARGVLRVVPRFGVAMREHNREDGRRIGGTDDSTIVADYRYCLQSPGHPDSASCVEHQSDFVPVIVLVADGARVDTFTGDLSAFPALRRLRDEGGAHTVTTVFPSVTGPAYTPFLLGRFPGPVGIPGIRWYDRARTACGWPDHSRSYVGFQFGRIDDDLDAGAPTIFELVPNSVGALSVVTRGLTPSRRYGTLTPRSAFRVARTHFSGRPEQWLDIDREVLETIPRRMREDRPDYVFAALAGIDKASHAFGHDSPLVHDALHIVDATAARLRADAESGGWWADTHLWIVSDHGHSAVRAHEDLAGIIAATGTRTIAHPWTVGLPPRAAVKVSGNAMAHVYVGLADLLLARESVDLMLLPHSPTRCEVRSASRGNAVVSRHGASFRYERTTGDPLRHDADLSGSANETYDALIGGEYPDAVVQILELAGSARAGDIILSATPGWDFRARYEPIPHVSAHGGLHRDHMLVPLLTNRPPARRPRRTTDVFASTLAALGIPAPAHLDGESYV